MRNVLLQRHTLHTIVAARTTVLVEEVGIVEVSLELTDIAVVFVNTAFVRRGCGAFVAARPLSKHTGGVALALENFGDDDMVHVIGFLTDHGIVCITSVGDLSAPVFFVAANVRVSRVLPGHEGGAGGSGDGTAGVGLGEAHALCGETVEMRGGDVLLPVAGKVTVAHVVAHDVKDVGAVLSVKADGCHETGTYKVARRRIAFFHDDSIFMI